MQNELLRTQRFLPKGMEGCEAGSNSKEGHKSRKSYNPSESGHSVS